MRVLNHLFVCLILCLNISFLNGQNCSYVDTILNNGKEINAHQLAIDQIEYESGIHTMPGDPMAPLFGEDPSDRIYTEQMNVSRYLLNTVRLWHENQPNSREALYKCISRAERCPKRPPYSCERRERSLDGTCNNVKNPTWGASYTTYGHILPALFEDDISTIRRCSRSKAELPSGRIVGNKIYVAEILQDRSSNSLNPFENPEAKTPKRIKRILKEKVARLRPQIAKDTAYYAEPIERPWKNQPEEYVFSFNGYMFGQIASHDIGDRKLSKNPDRFAPGYQCCRKSNLAGMGQQISNPACFPIVLPANDPFYSKYNATCLNYVRSSTTVPTSCKMGSAEFVTSPTSYTDLSNIYSTDKGLLDSLRSFKDGQMLTNDHNVLPTVPGCTGSACFRIGDFRVNQTPALALLHSIFLRNHNRCCKSLAAQNPNWCDQRLFDESRRLNIAMYQHILFHEWVPLLLKKRYSYKFGILCERSESNCGQYQSNIDASILSDFMQGSYRALHVCIPKEVFVRREDGKIEQTYAFSDVVGVTDMLNYQYDGMLRGMLKQPIPCNNLGYNEEIRSKLFKLKNGMGTDLFSIDVNRGRDHGVPPYHQYYTKCTGRVVNEWDDLGDHFEQEHLKLLSEIYENVYDVDLVTGVVLEKRDNSLLGVVARCIMAEQFHSLKYGDRHFYSFAANPDGFTRAQINEIEKMSIAKLLCQNTKLKSVPQHAFLVESQDNPNIWCKQYRDFDFSLWT